MREDPIVEEVRKFREVHAARFGYNLRAIARDAREREGKSGHHVISRAGKPKAR